MIPNPIHKVLSTFQSCAVRALLMGGQACVFYGAAEFSRDTDFALLADADNLERLNAALRVDVMAKMRGVAEFADLWERRTTLQGEDGTIYELMSLSDLVQAKKTQRDKDWPMIRRLIEADRVACRGEPSPKQALFWLREARTPALLLELARQFPGETESLAAGVRPLLKAALLGDEAGIETSMAEEERSERAADRAYWEPLRKELERMRHA